MDKKKIGIIIGAILLVVLLVVASTIKPNESKTKTDNTELSEDSNVIYNNILKESEEIKDEERAPYTEITMATYNEKMSAEGKSLILLARPTCSYCELAEPILQRIIKNYNVEILYLDTDKLSDEEFSSILNSDEVFSDFGTPFLLLVENGEIIDVVDGVMDTAHYVDFLQRNSMI